MKNTKLMRIFVLIFSLALLIGSVIGITASAANSDSTYEIKSINIAHGDAIQVLIAIDAPIDEADMGDYTAKTMPAPEIEVKYTVGDKEKTANYMYYVNIYGTTTYYPVYYTAGIAIKDCGETILAEAHKSGTAPNTPSYKDVCVAEYLYARLYKDNCIFATEADGKAYDSKKFYINMLNYIASAQQVLWNDKEENADNQKTLVTDKIYAYVDTGKILGTGKSAGFVNGELTLQYNGSENFRKGWYVNTETSSEIVYGDVLTLKESAVLTPYIDTQITDFESCEVGTGLTAVPDTSAVNASNSSIYNASIVSFSGTLPDGYSFIYYESTNNTTNTDSATKNITTSNSYIKVTKDSLTGNKYMEFFSPKRTTYNSRLDNNTDNGGKAYSPGLSMTVTDVSDNANVLVWDYDAIYYSDNYSTHQIGFMTSTGSYILYPQFAKDPDNENIINIKDSDLDSEASVVASFEVGKLVNIRFEYYWNEGVWQIYIDGVYSGCSTTASRHGGYKHAKPAKITYNLDSGNPAHFMLDNVSVKSIYKEYNENPSTTVPVYDYEDFSTVYTKTYYEWMCNHETYLAEVAAPDEETGTAAGNLYGQASAETLFNATKLDFATGLKVEHGATCSDAIDDGYTKIANLHGATADILIDANGNRYLNLYSPERKSNRDRAYQMTVLPNMLHGADTENLIYVFDIDIKVDSTRDGTSLTERPFELIFRGKSGSPAQYNFLSYNTEELILHGARLGKWDEWNSLRFEIYPLGDTARIEVLRKNDSGEYEYVYTWMDSTSYLLSNLKDGVSSVAITPTHPASLNIDNVALYTAVKEYTTPEIALVYTAEGNEVLPSERIEALKSLIFERTKIGFYTLAATDASIDGVSEIVVGKSERAVSLTAKANLEAAIGSSGKVGYSIYVDENGSAAIYWSDFRVCDAAFDAFEAALLNENGLNLIAGYTKTEVMNLDEYLEARAEGMREEAWAELEAALPEAYRATILAELRELYDLYLYNTDSDGNKEYNYGMVEWLASLYTPIYSEDGKNKGGWFNSESARDTSCYQYTYNDVTAYYALGPDIENTLVALGFLGSSGMSEMYGDDWSKSTPEWLAEAIANWVYDLQDPDTFFYHPQWPKEFIEANGLQSRITRDRGSAKTLLRNFGYTVKYTGSSTTPTSYNLTGRLMHTSTVTAVSKVVAVSSSSLTTEYESFENFKAHIDSYKSIANTCSDSSYAWNFYSWGNEFQSMTSYMTDDMKDYLYEFFEYYQDPNTGMWVRSSAGLAANDYNPTNSLHKIASVYNSIGKPLKYTDKIIESTLEILSWEPYLYTNSSGNLRYASTATAIYNVWSCFPYVYNNILKYSAADVTVTEREAIVEGYKMQVFANAAELIDITRQHIELCKHDSGAFSYSPKQNGGMTKNQGCPAGTGTPEADVNGNQIATLAVLENLFGGLGLSEYEIPLFTEADRIRFLSLLEEIESTKEDFKVCNCGRCNTSVSAASESDSTI